MQHTSLPSQVPYTLSVAGSPVGLSGANPVPVASFSGQSTSAQGEVYPVRVTVGSLVGAASGEHRDSLTVSLIAH